VFPSRLYNYASRPGTAPHPGTARCYCLVGERENRPPRLRQSRAPRLLPARDGVFPLPAGEGKGEGERDAANQNGWKNFASSTRPTHRASSRGHGKTNFPTRSKHDRGKPPSPLILRAWLAPHPGPIALELGESTALFSLSSDAGGGEGRGEESRFYWISPLPNPPPTRSSQGEGDRRWAFQCLIQWQCTPALPWGEGESPAA
jgi:hypothetical protein